MSRPLICDNPACETSVSADELDRLLVDMHGESGVTIPHGWVTVSEIDAEGDDVTLGECCSRACASALLTMGDADAVV